MKVRHTKRNGIKRKIPIYRITAPLIEYCKKLQNVKNHFWDVEAAGSNPVTPTTGRNASATNHGKGAFVFPVFSRIILRHKPPDGVHIARQVYRVPAVKPAYIYLQFLASLKNGTEKAPRFCAGCLFLLKGIRLLLLRRNN